MRGEIPTWNNREAAKQAHRDLDGAKANVEDALHAVRNAPHHAIWELGEAGLWGKTSSLGGPVEKQAPYGGLQTGSTHLQTGVEQGPRKASE